MSKIVAVITRRSGAGRTESLPYRLDEHSGHVRTPLSGAVSPEQEVGA